MTEPSLADLQKELVELKIHINNLEKNVSITERSEAKTKIMQHS